MRKSKSQHLPVHLVQVLATTFTPSCRRIRVYLALAEAGHTLALVEEQLRVVLGHSRLGIEERQPQAPLDAQACIEVGTVLDRLPIANILEEALDLGQIWHGDDLDVHRGGGHGGRLGSCGWGTLLILQSLLLQHNRFPCKMFPLRPQALLIHPRFSPPAIPTHCYDPHVFSTSVCFSFAFRFDSLFLSLFFYSLLPLYFFFRHFSPRIFSHSSPASGVLLTM